MQRTDQPQPPHIQHSPNQQAIRRLPQPPMGWPQPGADGQEPNTSQAAHHTGYAPMPGNYPILPQNYWQQMPPQARPPYMYPHPEGGQVPPAYMHPYYMQGPPHPQFMKPDGFPAMPPGAGQPSEGDSENKPNQNYPQLLMQVSILLLQFIFYNFTILYNFYKNFFVF